MRAHARESNSSTASSRGMTTRHPGTRGGVDREEEEANSTTRDEEADSHKQGDQGTFSLCQLGSCPTRRKWQWHAEIGTQLRDVQTSAASSNTSAASQRAMAGCASEMITMP